MDDPRCRHSFARIRDRWVFAGNEVLPVAGDTGRISIGRNSSRGRSAPRCHLRSLAGGLAILHPLAQASLET